MSAPQISAPQVRSPLVTLLYNHNPFYAISAVLMLFAVRNAYGELQIGAINCWIMMGVLAVYTALLAAIGVLIVRRGKVWEDARSILLLLLLLFLAVSISADDLFVTMESSGGGALLLLCGYVFSAAVSEAALRGCRIELKRPYRIPYHLLLLLFFVAPWWCSPELHPRSTESLEWTLFLFPVTAAAILLGLLPAVRRGARYVSENGTPWSWPWFPWSAFGMLVIAVALRTFALCMTFGPTGPIWIHLSGGARVINFDTMWGPYFLIPPAFAVLVLMLEAGLVAGNRTLVGKVLAATPLLLLLALPISRGPVFRGFLNDFTTTVGSPLWLAVGVQLALFVWAWHRGVRVALAGAGAVLLLYTFVDRDRVTFVAPAASDAWPLFVVAAGTLVAGVRGRSSLLCTASALLLTSGMFLVLPETPLARFRLAISFHTLWISAMVVGLVLHDRFAHLLRFAGAMLMPVVAVVVTTGPLAAEAPVAWRLGYVVVLTVASLILARLFRSRYYLYAFTGMLGVAGYGAAVLGFRTATAVLGRAAMTSFLWSLAALLTGVLISAHKARWLPPRLFPRWTNGHNGGLGGAPAQPVPIDLPDGGTV